MTQQTPQERREAAYACAEGRNRFRQGKPVTDCPWSDDYRVFHFRMGWQAEGRKRRAIARRRALGCF